MTKIMSSNALPWKTDYEAVAWNVAHTTVSKEGIARSGSSAWPFPPFPNPKHKDQRKAKFNPENEEDAPL
jgi:hypothetical protein